MTAINKWQATYAKADITTPANPAWVLQNHADLLPFSGKALDFAGGLAGNGRFLAKSGLQTLSWDFSANACSIVNQWANINKAKLKAEVKDLTDPANLAGKFDVITVSNYLDREAFPKLEKMLKPQGLIFAQTFLAPVQENAPSNPEFYVTSREFIKIWSGLECLVNGEGWLKQGNKPAVRCSWFIGRNS